MLLFFLQTKKVHEMESCNDGRFKKGNTPWNRDLKGIHLSVDSEFKKGINVGQNHVSWKTGVHHMKKDCVHIWTGVNKRVRRPRKVYEENFGKIPEGFVIYHLDGDKNNDTPENLIAISRAELVQLNRRGKTK